MADWDDVRRIVAELPETNERDSTQWRFRDKLIAWERPLRRRDLEELGDAAPAGPILGVRVPDLGAQQALLADDPDVYFITSHFDGYPAVLVRLSRIGPADLTELIVEAWFSRAPKRLAAQYRAAMETERLSTDS